MVYESNFFPISLWRTKKKKKCFEKIRFRGRDILCRRSSGASGNAIWFFSNFRPVSWSAITNAVCTFYETSATRPRYRRETGRDVYFASSNYCVHTNEKKKTKKPVSTRPKCVLRRLVVCFPSWVRMRITIDIQKTKPCYRQQSHNVTIISS